MNDIEKIINFIIEIEKLKNISRKTMPVGLNRYENSAEHSWHVCLSALMLKNYANDDIDIDRVIRMLLIHDLGEIDAGDTIVYDENLETKNREADGIKRILQILPNGEAEVYLALWKEFELGETPDSKYAKAIDRIPPLLHNLHGAGHSWRKNDIPKEKVFSINSHIKEGSQKLWDVMKSKLEGAISDGILK
ncbi:HD domain-containing protein [Beggiatoa alba]|nr:HD domain-containing protein [Beggiatoa alba]